MFIDESLGIYAELIGLYTNITYISNAFNTKHPTVAVRDTSYLESNQTRVSQRSECTLSPSRELARQQ